MINFWTYLVPTQPMCVFVPVGIFFATNVHYLDEWLWSNNFSGRPSLFLKAQGSYMRCEEVEGVEGTFLGEILDIHTKPRQIWVPFVWSTTSRETDRTLQIAHGLAERTQNHHINMRCEGVEETFGGWNSKWSKLSFWIKIVVILSVVQLVTTFIFFSAWDKSRVKWDNSRNSTQKMRTLEYLIIENMRLVFLRKIQAY